MTETSPPTPVPIEGLVERLKRVDEEDHIRGCQGRAYDCSCGYDDLVLIAASDARAALTQMAGDLRDRDLTISVEQGKVTYRDKLLADAGSRAAAALSAEIERLTYELKRWEEATAERPDWEKLWAEQADRAEAAEASLAEAVDLLSSVAPLAGKNSPIAKFLATIGREGDAGCS